MGKYEDLERLQKLKEDGILTEEEFMSEKQKILNEGGNAEQNNTEVSRKDNNEVEIKGEFEFVKSKIPLELSEGENVIYQYDATAFTGVGTTAVNGLLTLTNKRILFNKKTSGKSFMATGLLGVALAAGNKNDEIKLSNIVSIESKKIRLAPGVEIITKDGYSHKFAIQNSSHRDMLTELVNSALK